MTNRLVPATRLDGLGTTLIRRMLADAPAGAINLGIGQTDADVPDCIVEALLRAPSLRRAPYELNAGKVELRERIGARYGVGPDQVLVTCGVQEAIALALLGTVNPGDDVVIPDPAFMVYESLTRIAGGNPVRVPLDPGNGMRVSWRELAPRLGEKTRLVVLASPGNPTGASCSRDEWARIADGLGARGIPYLSDEIYLDLQHVPEPHSSMWTLQNQGIVVSGLSKTHGLAGWRLGWMVVPAPMFAPLSALHQHLVTSAATIVQDAAMAAFSDEGMAHAGHIRAELGQRRLAALEVLADSPLQVVSGDGAFFVMVRVPDAADDLVFAREILHGAGVITIPGQAFGECGRGLLRLSYSVPIATFREGIARIQQWLTSKETR